MNIKLYGFNLRLEIIVLSILIWGIIASTSFCSCAGGVREGFRVGTNIVGSVLDYSMGDGVNASYIKEDNTDYNKAETNVKGLGVPLPEGKLTLFGENEMNPNCCPSSYSSSKGCVCMTSEQINYLNKRGGNRNLD